jgi:large repetitive protein
LSAAADGLRKAYSKATEVAGAIQRGITDKAQKAWNKTTTAVSALASAADDAYTGAKTWVNNHAPAIAGIATFAACEVVTGGAGSIGCAMLAGAAGNAVTYAMDCTKNGSCSVGGAIESVATGAATGLLGGGLSKLAVLGLKGAVPELAEAALSGGASRTTSAGEAAAANATTRASGAGSSVSRASANLRPAQSAAA